MTHRGRVSEVSKTKKPSTGPQEMWDCEVVEVFVPRV